MSKVKIVTDSSAHLRPGLAERLGITVIPQLVSLDGVTYREGLDVTPKDFLNRLAATDTLPTVAPPPESVFSDAYHELHQQHDSILSLHVSGELSNTCEVARRAAASLLGRCDIRVVDSLSFSLGLGMLVEAAAIAASEGANLEQIVTLIRGKIPHVYVVFLVDSLEYLAREDRIRPSQAVLGAMLGIKPLLTLEEGQLVPMEKVRTRALGVEKVLDFIFEFVRVEQVAVVQSNFSEDTTLLLEGLEALYPEWDVPVFTYSPSVAARIGRDALGVAISEQPYE